MSSNLRRSIIEFAVLVERMTQRLLDKTPGVLRGGSLIQAKNSGSYPRSGRIGDGEYCFHGSGCRFELDSGEVVDFDLEPNDESRFDEFRLRSFLESRSENWDQAAVSDALSELRERGILAQPIPGWYRLA